MSCKCNPTQKLAYVNARQQTLDRVLHDYCTLTLTRMGVLERMLFHVIIDADGTKYTVVGYINPVVEKIIILTHTSHDVGVEIRSPYTATYDIPACGPIMICEVCRGR